MNYNDKKKKTFIEGELRAFLSQYSFLFTTLTSALTNKQLIIVCTAAKEFFFLSSWITKLYHCHSSPEMHSLRVELRGRDVLSAIFKIKRVTFSTFFFFFFFSISDLAKIKYFLQDLGEIKFFHTHLAEMLNKALGSYFKISLINLN